MPQVTELLTGGADFEPESQALEVALLTRFAIVLPHHPLTQKLTSMLESSARIPSMAS